MKVVSVVGNRPQFIKSAPMSVALRERGLEEIVVHTGQHYDRELSQVFYDELDLPPPAYRLDLQTAAIGTRLSRVPKRPASGASRMSRRDCGAAI